MVNHHAKSWTQRTPPQRGTEPNETDHIEHHTKAKESKNHTSLGVAGHLVHMSAMLFPVLAAELITDAAKYKKAVKIGAVATTVLYEGLYTMREIDRRRKAEQLAEERCSSHK